MYRRLKNTWKKIPTSRSIEKENFQSVKESMVLQSSLA